jgi:hypothetical protein
MSKRSMNKHQVLGTRLAPIPLKQFKTNGLTTSLALNGRRSKQAYTSPTSLVWGASHKQSKGQKGFERRLLQSKMRALFPQQT